MTTTTKTLDPRTAEQICRRGGRVLSKNMRSEWSFDGANFLCTNGFVLAGFCLEKHEHPDYPAEFWGRKYPCELPGPEAKALIMAAPAGMLEGYERSLAYAEWWDGTAFRCDGYMVAYTWGDDYPCTYTVRIRESWAKRVHDDDCAVQKVIDSLKQIVPHTYTPGEVVKTEAEARAAMAQGWCLVDRNEDVWCHGVDGDYLALASEGDTKIEGPQNMPFDNADLPATVTTPDPTLFTPGMTVPAALAEKLCWAGWVVRRKYIATEWARHAQGIRYIGSGLTGEPITSFLGDDMVLVRYEPWRVPCDEYRWSGKEAAAALRAGMQARPGNPLTWVEFVNGRMERCDRNIKIHHTTPEEYTKRSMFGSKYRLRWPEIQQEEEKVETKTMTKAAKLEALNTINEDYDHPASKWFAAKKILDTTEPDTLSAGEALDYMLANRHAEIVGIGERRFVIDEDDDFLELGEDGWRVTALEVYTLAKCAPFTIAPPRQEYEVVEMYGLTLHCYADRVECESDGLWIVPRKTWERAARVLVVPDEDLMIHIKESHTKNGTLFSTEICGPHLVIGCKAYSADDCATIIAAMDKAKEGRG